MEEHRALTKDEKLALAMKIQGQIELSKARKADAYDVLMILGHLTFPGRKVELAVSDFNIL
jgi:hypothetical protein